MKQLHTLMQTNCVLHFITCTGSASGPAVDTDNVVTAKKKEECTKVVDAMFQLLEKRITAKQILTKEVANHISRIV